MYGMVTKSVAISRPGKAKMTLIPRASSQPPNSPCLPSRRMKRKPTTTGEIENGRSRSASSVRFPGIFTWVKPHAMAIPTSVLSGTAIKAMSKVSLMAWMVSREPKVLVKVAKPSEHACAMTLANGRMIISATWMKANAISARLSQVGSSVGEFMVWSRKSRSMLQGVLLLQEIDRY